MPAGLFCDKDVSRVLEAINAFYSDPEYAVKIASKGTAQLNNGYHNTITELCYGEHPPRFGLVPSRIDKYVGMYGDDREDIEDE